jgi:hypothetical protein
MRRIATGWRRKEGQDLNKPSGQKASALARRDIGFPCAPASAANRLPRVFGMTRGKCIEKPTGYSTAYVIRRAGRVRGLRLSELAS